MRIDTIRSTSRALPSTASTAGPGSAFHGSAVSSSALVSRINRQVASSARWGWPAFHAAEASASTVGSHVGQAAIAGSGAGPTPPHLEATTAATLEARLPRLLARSAL